MAKETKNDDNVVKINLQEIAEKQNAAVDEVHKVDLSKPKVEVEETVIDETVEEITDEVVEPIVDSSGSDDDTGGDDAVDADPDTDDDVIVEITEDETDEVTPEVATTVSEEEIEQAQLPENIQKLVEFINDTGGTVEDYVLLNRDTDALSESQLLLEYHKSVEPGLENEEYQFIMEDSYDFDEDIDDDRTIKKKQIAKKRAVAKAKQHLEGLKTKYYDEIKAGSKLNPEQKKAVDFFNRYNEDQKGIEKTRTKRQQVFAEKTKSVFNDEFKGFEFKVGEKRYRYNVKDAKGVMNAQADIENFTKKYLGDDKTLQDAQGYHKALFTAMNADAIADHFYKQGAADAIKGSAKTAKNINMGPRQGHDNKIPNQTGFKARVVENETPSGRLRIKK